MRKAGKNIIRLDEELENEYATDQDMNEPQAGKGGQNIFGQGGAVVKVVPSAILDDQDSVVITPAREVGKIEQLHMSPNQIDKKLQGNNSRSGLFDQSNTSDLNLAAHLDP